MKRSGPYPDKGSHAKLLINTPCNKLNYRACTEMERQSHNVDKYGDDDGLMIINNKNNMKLEISTEKRKAISQKFSSNGSMEV
jgi:hypothetical protein